MRRVFQGVPLVRRDNMWHTEDGRYTVSEDANAITWCDGPHPVRTGYKEGYQCPGGQEHSERLWNVWDNEKDDHAFGDVYDTMREAVRALADHLQKEAK
ncbi:hypothetical protein PBI_MRMAGOO_162 [Mycobacterium phage MrMagoo]|uniref:Uncharacterized protein n=1 Tax=Mycobacterium phage MrMagoo TaxID=1927020 RepID=A0A1L6BYS0_9CAUD|nr:hypothetical protein J4U04_gp118 [Mycobacterium phage MrMagoo]APQ42244.1 hypothetical protein PBI_MRMAGOO_162 [Mycobacterium phage MrMagoo]ARM70313.1 hypothetical protein SEA_GARDENSALSA_160 [Mycobacterium phage GardenSalsa]